MYMKKIVVMLVMALAIGCSKYRDSIQGRWELAEVRNSKGVMLYEVCKEERRCDVVEIFFETSGNILTVTALDENGKQLKAVYTIKEDGRLVSASPNKPNMYIMDLGANKVTLIEQFFDANGKLHERLLVFKKVELPLEGPASDTLMNEQKEILEGPPMWPSKDTAR